MAKREREVNGIVIRSDLPVPVNNKSSGAKFPFPELEVGESMFLKGETLTSTGGSMQWFARKLGRKFLRKTEDGGVRIWRVE